MAPAISSDELLDLARNKFAAGLWETSGWGSGDRRCIVGTVRDLAGTGTDSSMTQRKNPANKKSWDREPYFTAYEEVIFACAGIIDPSFDPVREYKHTKSTEAGIGNYILSGFSKGHAAILATLDHAERILIHYNDATCQKADEMIRLMEQATQIVKEQRDARAEEWSGGGSTTGIINSALNAIPGLRPDQVVMASDADSKAAREEYEALRDENPDLPPIFSWWMGDKSHKKAKRRQDAKAKVRTPAY